MLTDNTTQIKQALSKMKHLNNELAIQLLMVDFALFVKNNDSSMLVSSLVEDYFKENWTLGK